jgi:four helix bundle protein
VATFKKFEDIDAWNKARELAGRIYDVSGKGEFNRDHDLRLQIRAAATSVMSNIAEGFERGGNREFVNFLSIARGSRVEVRSQLYVALDQKYIHQAAFQQCYDMAAEIAGKLTKLMNYLNRTKIRGSKFDRRSKTMIPAASGEPQRQTVNRKP